MNHSHAYPPPPGKHHSFVILFSALRILHQEKSMSFLKAIYKTQLKNDFLDIV
jgi:hypothetical protein